MSDEPPQRASTLHRACAEGFHGLLFAGLMVVCMVASWVIR